MEALEVTSTHSSEFDGSSIVEDDNDSTNAFVERVRVDRRKLEEMLQETDSGEPTMADGFFRRIMETTGAHISWPTKLKIGAKSKKDPHVKVSGLPEAIVKARENILELLDTKRNRVTLKMDVSFTDHSYIIGKGGRNIQQVMDDTGCHIHFPDSNRNSHSDKSNQASIIVSIAGQPAGVERARAQIRELLPMVVSFDLPTGSYPQPSLDPSSLALQGIQKSHGITVTFRRVHAALTVVIVKGSRRHADRLRQGLNVLVDYLVGGSRAPLNLVTLSTEIAPQHHSFVMGRNNCNLQHISRLTGCIINFPDPSVTLGPASMLPPPFLGPLGNGMHQNFAPGLAGPSKSTVQIVGHFDAVFTAWLELMGWLPLVLMFDLKEGQDIEMLTISRLMDQLNVNIGIKPKPKRNSKCIVVRCAERDSRHLFEVRRILLDLTTDELGMSPTDQIPYPSPSALLFPKGNLQEQIWREIKESHQQQSMSQQQQLLLSMLMSAAPGQFFSQQRHPLQPPVHAALLPLLLSQLSLGHKPGQPGQFWTPPSSNSCHFSNWKDVERVRSPEDSSSCSRSSGVSCTSPSSRESPIDYGYGSVSCKTVEDLRRRLSPEEAPCRGWEAGHPTRNGTGSAREDLWRQGHHPAVVSQHTSPKECSTANDGWTESPSYQKSVGPVGCERKVTFSSPLPHLDYEGRKLLATKAMQEPVGATKRVPSSTWSGFGFSKSMPESVIKEKFQSCRLGASAAHAPKLEDTKACLSIEHASPSKVWSNQEDSCLGATGGASNSGSVHSHESAFSFSNFFDAVGAHPVAQHQLFHDIPHLFNHLSLGKYVDIFQQNEIDLQTFLVMTDSDLQQLCIPYGARKKMLLAISDLNSQKSGFSRSFQAAPGAERRGPGSSPPKTLVDPCW
ncbi:unnamed protein product [Ixodes hexagonus]